MSNKLKVEYDRVKTYTLTANQQVGTDIWFEALYGAGTKTRTVPAMNDSNTIFVQKPPTGNDGNAGTEAAPKATIQAAITAAISGAKSYVRVDDDGVYEECIEISGSVSLYAKSGNSPTIKYPTYANTINSRYGLGGGTPELRKFAIGSPGGRYIYACCNRTDNLGVTVYRSSDGITWTSVFTQAGSGMVFRNFLNAGGAYEIICFTDTTGSAHNVYYSSTGASGSWTGCYNSYPVYAMEHFLSWFFIATHQAGTGILKSTSGIGSWGSAIPTITDTYDLKTYGAYMYIARGVNGLYRTGDGSTNELISATVTGTKFDIVDDRIFCFDDNNLWYSLDGSAWTKVNYTFTQLRKIYLPDYIYTGSKKYYDDKIYIVDGDKLYRTTKSFLVFDEITDSTYNWDILFYEASSGYGNNRIYFGHNNGVYEFNQKILNISFSITSQKVEGFYLDGDSRSDFCSYSGSNNELNYNNIFDSIYMLTWNIGSSKCQKSYLKNSKIGINNDASASNNILYCIIYNCDFYGIFFAYSTDVYNLALIQCGIGLYGGDDVKNTIFYNNNYDIYTNSVSSDATYCVITGVTYGTVVGATNKAGDPLFLNIIGEDFRLQNHKKTDSNGNYYVFDSAGYLLGDDGFDAGCFKETLTLASDTWTSYTFEYNPKTKTISKTPVNLVSFETADGNIHQKCDGNRLELLLQWESDTMATMKQWHNLVNILKSNTVLRVYFNNDSGYQSGTYVTNLANLTAQLVGATWITNQWAGFWIQLVVGVSDYYYYIVSNTADTLTLQDVEEYGLSSSSSYFGIILFMEMRLDRNNEFSSTSEWTGFARMDSWHYTDLDNLQGGGMLTGYSLKLIEEKH